MMAFQRRPATAGEELAAVSAVTTKPTRPRHAHPEEMPLIYDIPAHGFCPALPRVVLAALAFLLAGACTGQPTDHRVQTNSPSGSWTAPSAKEVADRDRALVRVIAAIPGLSRLDLFADGQKIAGALEYKTITPYMEVQSGRQPLRLRPAGMDTADPLAEQTHQLRAGQHYTLVIMPGENGSSAAAVRIFDDALNPPEGGRAKLRIVHAAADAGRVDVHMEGRADPLASGLEFQRASDFIELQPPAGPIELRPADRTETMLRLPDLGLSAGGMYTVVVIGRTRTEPPLETLVLEDRIARP